MDTSGFYLLESGGTDGSALLFAPNFVDSPWYSISREHKDTYEYPVHGWRWFESRQEALDFHGVADPPPVDPFKEPDPVFVDMTVDPEPQ